MNGRIVIVGYAPKPGREVELLNLLKSHVDRLRQLDLASDRPSLIMRSASGVFIELFEWKSKEAIEKAHTHPEVLLMWEEFAEVGEYVPVGELDEMSELFSEFEPLV